ncbi:hypothetical protein BG005_006860 [Podila minutissima]|nr:hypothetical protein BG005_006860 [Podila minutissima]
MQVLAQHPKFQDVEAECCLFPDHAEQLFQVYLDLTEAKGFENVSVIPAPLLGRCLIEGKNVDNGNDYTVLPVLVTETWSLEKMQDVFSSLDKEQDLRLQTAASSKITLALIAADSTLTYVNLYRGVPPEPKDTPPIST